MIINNKNLDKFQKKYSWSGTGSRENPIRIEKTPVPHLSFSKINKYCILHQLELDSLTLYSCNNFHINECKIGWFDLESCQEVRVEGNKINKAQIFYTRQSKFVNNFLDNDIDKQYISENLPKLEVKLFRRDIRNVCIFLLINLLISLLFLLVLNLIGFVTYNIFGLTICLNFLLMVYIKLRRTRKFSPNQFRNNQSIDLSIEFGI